MASGMIKKSKRALKQIGYAVGGASATITYDLSNVDFVYAVLYSTVAEKYAGGEMMPVYLFSAHPQVIDYYNIASGIVDYDSSINKVVLTSNQAGYSLYLFAVV